MVRIPSFARRPEESTATEDRTRDGRADQRDERTDAADRPTADTRPVTVRDQVDDRGDRRSADTATADVDTPATGDTTDDAPVTGRDRVAERTVETTPAGPKPRASLLATLGLIVGVAAALMVLTGVLAGYGLAAGVIGLLLSIGGVSATGKRHVAGKSDALIGIALSVGAMIVGALALTGTLSWLTTETDKVEQFRLWLDAQFGNPF